MTESEIEAKVIDIVCKQMGADGADVSRETRFDEDLKADSLDQVELMMDFEDAFNTSISDEDAEQIKTVGNAVEFISKNNGSAG